MTKAKSKGLALVLSLIMLLTLAMPALAVDVTDFTDVSEDHWGYDMIAEAVERELFVGTSATTFDPNIPMTRAMFVTVLGKMAGAEMDNNTETKFTDVTVGGWYAGAVAWASDSGVVAGMSESTFEPHSMITREQMAVMIRNYIDWAGITLPQTTARTTYADNGSISSWAVEAVYFCQETGLMEGMGNNTFSPKSDSTRAQAAVVTVKLANIIEETAGAPKLNVESTIFGEANTGNKSTLKAELLETSGPGDTNIYYYDENGNRVTFPEGYIGPGNKVTYTGEALLKVEAGSTEIDDSKINSTNAVVSLAQGEGYYVDELILNATSLQGDWENGQLSYTLDVDDLEWYTGDYILADHNSGREWSVFGGDGNGCYTFNFEVDGITYDGEPLEAQTFQVEVYIWGSGSCRQGFRLQRAGRSCSGQHGRQFRQNRRQ